MPVSNEDIDDLVDRAVREIRAAREEGKRSTVVAKARELGIHKDRIHRRLKGIGSRIDRKAANPKLSVIQETSLIRYILSLDEIDHSVRYDQINNVTNAILLQDHITDTPASSVGSKWARRFLDRHSELYKVKQKSLELERKLVHDSDAILNWFERFQAFKKRYSIQNVDIWNFDEIDFQIDVGKSQ